MCLAAAVVDPYPRFSYYPRNVAAPEWVDPLVDVFRTCRSQIDTVLLSKGISSDEVLEHLRSGLVTLGFEGERGGLTLEAGAIDSPTGGQLTRHIFVADKGDYYQIDDGLPQFTGWE